MYNEAEWRFSSLSLGILWKFTSYRGFYDEQLNNAEVCRTNRWKCETLEN